MDDIKTFGEAASQALTNVQASPEQSTKGNSTSNGSAEIEHKRYFLRTFRRWEILFKRKDGNVEADKWLIAEYYKSLGHLSPAALDILTEELKKTCIFFPAIAECLAIINPPRYSYSNPFYNPLPRGQDAIGSLAWFGEDKPRPIAYDGGGE